jgi:2-haloacid dehalogenase
LNHALAENKLTLSQSAIDTLTASYNTLSLFPDVQPLFTHLQQHSEKFYPVIFSNGTANMLSATLTQSPEIEPHAHVFKDVVVVEPVKRFKPCPSVYEYLCKKVGKKDWKEAGLKNVWLISGNPFDIVGAKACGMGACWVDRSGAGWVDQCVEGANGRPDVIVRGLDEVCQKIGQFLSL